MSPEEEQDILEYIRITGMSKERLVSISRGKPFTGEIPRLYTQSQLDQALSELQAKILAVVRRSCEEERHHQTMDFFADHSPAGMQSGWEYQLCGHCAVINQAITEAMK